MPAVASPARTGRWGTSLLVMASLALLTALFTPVATAVEPLPVEDELPTPRYGYGAAMIGSKGYLVGGGVNGSYSGQIVLATPSSGVVGNLPKALIEPAAAAVGGKLYVFGGAEEAGPSNLPTPQSTVYEFNPTTGDTRRLLGTSLPAPATSISAVTLGPYIYLFGGLALSTDLIDWKEWILRFDPATGELRTLDVTLPTGRGQMAAVAVDDTILLFGGFAENGEAGTVCEHPDAHTCFTDQILRFRPTTNGGSIGVIGQLPDRLRWAAAAAYEDTVYIFGGCTSNCGAFYGFDHIIEVDPSTGEAERLPVKLPTKGGRYHALVQGDIATIPGGSFRPQGAIEPRIMADVVQVRLGATRPWAPIGLEAAAIPTGGVELSWSPPTYDGGAPVLSYEVFRSAGASDPLRIGEIDGTSFKDTRARLGSTYTYQVRATNVAGVSALSNEARITPTATPSAPTLSVHGGNDKVVAQWSDPDEAGGLGVESYRLYTAQGTTARCEDIHLWGELTSTYVVVKALGNGTAVENGKTYALRVQARNDNGWGPCTEPMAATASPVPDAPASVRAATGAGQGRPIVNVTWNQHPSSEVTGFVVYRGTTLDGLAPVGETTKNRFTDSGELPGGVRLHYAVAARSAQGEGPLSQTAVVAFAGAPGPVEALSARWTGTEVLAWWEAPIELGGGTLDGYEVARTRGAIDPAEANATIESIAAPPYSDPDPPRGAPLVYHVRAVGTGGAGEWTMFSLRIPLTDDSVPPRAVLSVSPSVAEAGERIVFDASASTDDEGVVAYSFAFGDGAKTGWGSSPRVEHTYDAAGIYEASVHVRDLRGLESVKPATAVIAIGPGPDVDEDPRLGSGEEEENGSPVPLFVTLVALGLAAMRRRRSR